MFTVHLEHRIFCITGLNYVLLCVCLYVCVFACGPWQEVQQGLELLADDVDHAALDGVVGHVDEEDEGGRLRKLVVLSRGRN